MIKKFLPSTTKRVADNTCDKVNAEIRDRTVCSLNVYKDCDEGVLSDIICKLKHEWDTERVLESNAAGVMLLGSALGFAKSKSCMYLLTGAAGMFLLQHALQGWCPPLPMIRKMGIRTAEEINNERTVLKWIRGDFSEETSDINDMFTIAEKN